MNFLHEIVVFICCSRQLCIFPFSRILYIRNFCFQVELDNFFVVSALYFLDFILHLGIVFVYSFCSLLLHFSTKKSWKSMLQGTFRLLVAVVTLSCYGHFLLNRIQSDRVDRLEIRGLLFLVDMYCKVKVLQCSWVRNFYTRD